MELYAIKLSVEVSAVLCSEWTKYCPILRVCDLLVTFTDIEYISDNMSQDILSKIFEVIQSDVALQKQVH